MSKQRINDLIERYESLYYKAAQNYADSSFNRHLVLAYGEILKDLRTLNQNETTSGLRSLADESRQTTGKVG